MGQTTGTTLSPIGQEIGGLIASMVQTVLDLQYVGLSVSVTGISGTNPSIFVDSTSAIGGTDSIKKFVDSYTALAFDETTYPDAPLAYEYHMRDDQFLWRKQKALTSNPVLSFTVGKDAVLSGNLSVYPVYSDYVVSSADKTQSWEQHDIDTRRRWGGRSFWGQDRTASSFLADAQALAVRSIELFKNERVSFTLIVQDEAFLAYPGDIVSIYGGELQGLVSGNYRISEVRIDFHPTMVTTLVIGDTQKLLLDYL